MEIEVCRKEKQVAKTLKLHCKVADMFTASLVDNQGQTICDQDDGYVPSFMPGEHYGDYVILDIDIDSGLITNWKTPKPYQIEEWANKCNGFESED